MATQTETALQAKLIAPGFTVNDLEQSIRFYEGLGFAIDERWESEGKLVGVMLRAGNAMLGLNQDDWAKGKNRVKGVGMRVWISTGQDIDQVAARAKASGITLESEPEDTEWGGRAFTLTDLDGFKLTISNWS